MSGGAYEYTASYDKLGNSTYVAETFYGKSMTDTAKSGSNYKSTKYVTAYSNGTSKYLDSFIYSVGKVGDATKEVFKGYSAWGYWFKENAFTVRNSDPFFLRGGYCGSGVNVGMFNSSFENGARYDKASFRVILCL